MLVTLLCLRHKGRQSGPKTPTVRGQGICVSAVKLSAYRPYSPGASCYDIGESDEPATEGKIDHCDLEYHFTARCKLHRVPALRQRSQQVMLVSLLTYVTTSTSQVYSASQPLIEKWPWKGRAYDFDFAPFALGLEGWNAGTLDAVS